MLFRSIFSEDAVTAVAEAALERSTGARGLRSIVEDVMLNIMFEVPSLEGVTEVAITKEVIEKKGQPIITYSAEKEQKQAKITA